MSSNPADGTATPVTQLTSGLAGVNLAQSWGDIATAPATTTAAAPAVTTVAAPAPATTTAPVPGTTAAAPAVAVTPAPPAVAPAAGAGASADTPGTVELVEESARARDDLVKDAFTAPTTVGKEEYMANIAWEDPSIGLSAEVIRGAIEMGWEKPTRAQAVGLSLLIRGRALPAAGRPAGAHVLVKAATGAGKTGCFGLAAVSTITPGIKGPQVVVILPSRPLAVEVATVITGLGKHVTWEGKAGLPVGLAIGGMARTRITQPVLVCCFGSLLHWSKKSTGLIDLSNVKLLAVDEADEFTSGKSSEMLSVVKLMKRDVQIALFSATFACLKEERGKAYKFITKLVGASADHPERGRHVRAEVVTDVTHPNTLVFNRVFDSEADKFTFLKMFAAEFGDRILVFCNKGDTVDRLARNLSEDWTSAAGPQKGIKAGIMKGGMRKDHIDTFFRQFNENSVKVLVSTRRAGARGLNYPGLRLVVEFDIPRDEFGVAHDSYHHQLGRVGRMGTPGVVLNLLAGVKDMEGAAELSRDMKRHFEVLPPTVTVKDCVAQVQGFIARGWEARK